MTKRIDKLCAVKERDVEAAEGALAQVRASVTAAEHALAATVAGWEAAMNGAASAWIIADLSDADARVRSLRQAVQRAEAALKSRRVEEERLRGVVSAARMELRRFEMWGERADVAVGAARDRLTRSAEDALCARLRGTSE